MGKFAIKRVKKGYRFNLVAGNGEIIATSETFPTREACICGVESMREAAPSAALEDQTVEGFAQAECPKFEIYTDKAGEFRFRLRGEKGDIAAVSEGYKAKASSKKAVESVRRNAPGARLAEEGAAQE